mgnify:CR=1 FL=1
MTTLDNKGNTKLVLEDNKIVASYESTKLYLTSYKIKLGGDYYFTHKQTNTIHHFQDPWLGGNHPGVLSDKHYAEVVDGDVITQQAILGFDILLVVKSAPSYLKVNPLVLLDVIPYSVPPET